MLSVMEKPATITPKVKNAGTLGWLQQSIHRSRNEVFTEVKTVTPALADAILLSNHDNRKLREVKLAQLASDMSEGRWTFNGEPVIIAKTGELNDGQHRLHAVIQSQTPIPMLFVFGVERESRTTVDQGAARSAGDYLHMEGVPYATTLSAIARLIITYELNRGRIIGRANQITAAQIIERAKRDRTLSTSAAYAGRHAHRMKRFASVSVVGFCHNVLLNKNTQDGMAFMEQLCTGENLERSDPAFTARERLLGMERSSVAAKIEIILRAWNAYREKRQMRTIPVHGRLPELV